MPDSCVPSDLLKDWPCFSCLSTKDLLAILVYEFALISEYDLPGDTAELLDASACYTCLSDKQLLIALVAMLADVAFREGLTMSEIESKIKCLNCASEKQLKAAIMFLLCSSYLAPN